MSRKLIDNIVAIFAVAAVWALTFLLPVARANPLPHDKSHQSAHQKYHRYYAGIMRPDRPKVSCCSNQDCAPAQAKYNPISKRWTVNKHGLWVDVPPEKIVPQEQVPDELGSEPHLCAPPPSWTAYGADEIFCFILGSGGV
jgi:hypothetical protein